MFILGASRATAPQTVFPTNVQGTTGAVVVAGVSGTLDPPTEPTFFVDQTLGNDDNDGMAGNPWKTVQKVNDAGFSPGEIIAFKRGEVWRETLIPPSSGSSDKPITFTAYGSGAAPIINGADFLTSWSNTSGDVWEAAAASQVRNVFLNGTKQHQGVTPNPPVDDDFASTNDAEVTITDSVAKVEAKGDGAWWWDDSANKLYIHSTAGDPGDTNVEGSVRNFCITFTSKNYVTFENLALKNAKITNFDFFGTSDNCILDNLDVSFGYFDGIRISGAATNTLVQNCHSFSNGRLVIAGSPSSLNNGHGIDVATTGAGTVVDNNECDLNAEDGAQVQPPPASTSYTISNNHFHHNNEDGIDMKAGDVTNSLVEKNRILSNEQVGIRTLGSALGATIQRNEIGQNGNVALWLTAGINAAKVHANLLFENGIASDSSSVNRAGIRVDANDAITGAIEIFNNTVYHTDENTDRACMYTLSNANNVDMRNNIFYHGGGYRSLNVQNAVTGMTERWNMHFDNSGTSVILIVGTNYNSSAINDGPPSTYTTAEGLGEDSLYADPQFDTVGGGSKNDYKIKDASAAKGAGDPGGLLVATDIDGVSYTDPPNMGCFAGTV